MSRECVGKCPRIGEIVENIDTDNLLAGPMAIHLDAFGGEDTGVARLLRACTETYDCPGPRTETVIVEKGLFRKRLVSETVVVCGLDK